MTLNRRRFLTISACFAGAPSIAQAETWTGRAFGAEINITLTGPRDRTSKALQLARGMIVRLERAFSLYDQSSELVHLNSVGQLAPSPEFLALMQIADRVHALTGGLFDPTVQPLWRALHTGCDVEAAQRLVGWSRVRVTSDLITLAPGQALTLNGIAQGFASDRVSDALADLGFHQTLVNIGEHRARGGPWKLALDDPEHGRMGILSLTEGAIATSSPLTTDILPAGHIVHPVQPAHWSTVTVEAETAAEADALSTGLVMAEADLVRRMRSAPGVRRIALIDFAGNLHSV